MGYDIAIGEAEFIGDTSEWYMRVWAKREAHDTAPTFANDPMTGNTNCRSPGYSVWTNFCRSTGLYGAFYGMNGQRVPYMEGDPDCYREVPILADHPGYAPINQQDADAFRAALDRHIAKHGYLEAGFRRWDEPDDEAPPDAEICAERARLLWLVYWTEWAVKNCTWPVIANR